MSNATRTEQSSISHKGCDAQPVRRWGECVTPFANAYHSTVNREDRYTQPVGGWDERVTPLANVDSPERKQRRLSRPSQMCLRSRNVCIAMGRIQEKKREGREHIQKKEKELRPRGPIYQNSKANGRSVYQLLKNLKRRERTARP